MENEQEKEGKKVGGRRKNKRASPPAPLRMERGVVCEVTPIGLLAHVIEFFLSHWVVFSLTERTEFTEVFGAHFEPTEGLRHTEFTERYSHCRYK